MSDASNAWHRFIEVIDLADVDASELLAVLPPSIIVDGRVVELSELYARYANQSECIAILERDARRVIAAREVAQ